MGETEIDGWVAPGFEGVRQAFAENFASHGDKGVSLGVYVDGEPVVFQLPTPSSPQLSADSFGHQGAGGALGFADVRHKVGFGYVQNQLLGGGPAGDPRTLGLIAAVARAIGA